MCLHGTAQSGHEQCIPKSRHDDGKTFNRFSFAISKTAGESLWFSSSATMAGWSRMPSIRLSISFLENLFTSIFTL